MKKFLALIFLSLVFSAGFASAEEVNSVSSTDQALNGVDNFHAGVRIRPDAVLEVEERIDYNFGPGEWHGIVRDIPIEYEAHRRAYLLSISGISVTDEKGAAYPFIRGILEKHYRIKIGDPGVPLSGKKTYLLRYLVHDALGHFPTHDELYWNVTGNRWNVPIATTTATVILPKKFKTGDIRRECYVGFFSDRQRCRDTDVEREEGNADTILFTETALAQGEGLTISVGFPKGAVEQVGVISGMLEFLRVYYLISFTACLFVLGVYVCRTLVYGK